MKNIFEISMVGLARTATLGFSWNLVGSLVRNIAAFVINILLARLLGPKPFGLVALAWVVIGLGNLLIESGLSMVLIQKKDVSDQDVDYIFTIQMMLGVILATLIFAGAPLFASLLADPDVIPVLRIMVLVLVFQAFAQVPTALLRRQLNFKVIQKIQIGSYLFSYLGLGIPMALVGLGVWSLVIAQVAQSFLNTVLIYLVARRRIRVTLDGQRDLQQFGIRILSANIANYIIQNVDNLIVGWAFGSVGLGLYNRAFYLGMTPASVIVAPAQAVLVPTISKLENHAHTVRIFVGISMAFAALFFPPYLLLALGARDFIQIILGSKWELAAPLLIPLALATPLFALMAIQGPILIGLGKPEYEVGVQWKTAVLAVIILLVTSQISLGLLAWSVVLIYAVRLVLMTQAITTVLGIPWGKLLWPFVLGLLLAGIVGASWGLCGFLLPPHWDLWVRLSLQSLIALTGWITLLVLGRDLFFEDGYEMYYSLQDKRVS